MKTILIPSIPEFDKGDDLTFISLYMDMLAKEPMACQPWADYKTIAGASFSMAHTGQHLLLKYYVHEDELKAVFRDVNGEVSKDNCVELFISFNDAADYYNLEFNCLGSSKVAYGSQRNGRTFLPAAIIEKIKIHTYIDYKQYQTDNTFAWEICLLIPLEVFMFTAIDTFAGLTCRANFYKCGDDLAKPHFLTWNMIDTPAPDFHQPQYFGYVKFLDD